MGTQASTAAAPRDAAARLFEQYGPQLYRFCLGRMRSREEAEDAVQSTFLRVYKALDKGAVPEYEAAWLYKIAHNVCLSRREVIGRRGRLESPTDFDEIEYALAAPETHHDELAGLSGALADLPVNLRQAILLREWQGLSYAEIADAMGTTVSAVETLIFRARKQLAATLEPERRRPTTLAGLLGALLGRISFAAPAAKLAAGAALVAIGGAGVGAAVELQSSSAATSTGSSTQAAIARTAPAPATAAVQLVTLRSTVARATPAAAAPAATPVATPAAVISTLPPSSPAVTTAVATPAPATTTSDATPATPAPAVQTPVATPTTTLPAVPTPSVAAVTTPTPSLTSPATIATPTVPLPSLPAPALPAATLPTVTVPIP